MRRAGWCCLQAKALGAALVPLIARGQGNAYQGNGKQGTQPASGICPGGGFGLGRARARKSSSFHLYCLRSAVASRRFFVGDFLADGRAGAVLREGADMDEDRRISLKRRNESEAPVIVPGLEGACFAHLSIHRRSTKTGLCHSICWAADSGSS